MSEVFANGKEVACKKGDGKVVAAMPDVCLSPPPPPAGPVPVPYPNSSFAKDTQAGSKTVKIQGAEAMLRDSSFYSTSPLGNEAATRNFGGSVVTHTITGKTFFVAWSMDVKFEGENVDRHTDLTTSNHASQPGSTPPNGNLSKGKTVRVSCPHDEIIRTPPKNETPSKEGRRRLEKQRQIVSDQQSLRSYLNRAVRCEQQAMSGIGKAVGQRARAYKLFNKALGLDGNIRGAQFEERVADETRAKETSVKVKCKKCGKTLGEFDVVTHDGVVKECKADAHLLSPKRFLEEHSLVQRPDVFGPGTVLHVAIPKGQRQVIVNKFKPKYNTIKGKIQEH